MAIYRLCMFLIAVSLATGIAESSRKASAIVPGACPMYECKTTHAFWDGVSNKTIVVYFIVGGDDTQNSSQGKENIFTQASVEKKPLVATGGNVDVWAYDKCNPMCGKDANGKWQASQEVVRGGARSKDAIVLNLGRVACTSNDGKNGPTISVLV